MLPSCPVKTDEAGVVQASVTRYFMANRKKARGKAVHRTAADAIQKRGTC